MYFLGSRKSTKSAELYCKQENNNTKLMRGLLIYSSFVIITVYVPPTLFPISYEILGFPSPKYWYLPYPTV